MDLGLSLCLLVCVICGFSFWIFWCGLYFSFWGLMRVIAQLCFAVFLFGVVFRWELWVFLVFVVIWIVPGVRGVA